MSKCISHQGEYSEHELVAESPFICQRCFVFDEEPALAALVAAEMTIERVRAVVDECDRRLITSPDRVLKFWNHRLRDALYEPSSRPGQTGADS